MGKTPFVKHLAKALSGLLLLPAVPLLPAQEPEVVRVWPGDAPGAERIRNKEPENLQDGHISHVHEPTLTLFRAPKDTANGTAVVICPGGGYGVLAIEKEGYAYARWLNTLGVTACVLKYRLNDYGYPAPLLDAQRAIRIVRSRAAEWGIDPARIGIMGSSAGGHLASAVGTHYDRGAPDAKDPVERLSCRPDFMMLLYPVISMGREFGHGGSRANLLGPSPSEELIRKFSNETQVTPDTPPAFLVHATDDTGVPVENSIAMYKALHKAGVPVEMHLYERGGHGFGMLQSAGEAATWPDRCAAWLRGRGLLQEGKTKQ